MMFACATVAPEYIMQKRTLCPTSYEGVTPISWFHKRYCVLAADTGAVENVMNKWAFYLFLLCIATLVPFHVQDKT